VGHARLLRVDDEAAKQPLFVFRARFFAPGWPATLMA